MKKKKSELFRLLEIPRFAVVDIETTGGNYRYNKIIEIAAIITDGKNILDEFRSLVNPQRNIPEFITQITNITNEMVENAPTYNQIAPQLYDILSNNCFVAHNVSFDYDFVKQEFREAGFNFHTEKQCTVRIGRKLIKLLSYRLDCLCDHFNITIHDRHRAYGDALATTYLLHEYLKIIREAHGEVQLLFSEDT